MEIHDEQESKLRIWWKPVSVGTLIAVVPMIVAMNQAYVNWHDVRYPRRSEIVYLADAKDLQSRIEHAHQTSEANAVKLDFLVKKAARDEIRQLKQDIANHKENEIDSALWRRQLIQLQNNLEGAENYFNCIQAQPNNCESER